jgi:hypothetical protein
MYRCSPPSTVTTNAASTTSSHAFSPIANPSPVSNAPITANSPIREARYPNSPPGSLTPANSAANASVTQ